MESEPQARFPTIKAINAVCLKLNWRHNLAMQDWPLEISDENKITETIKEYRLSGDDDEKFVLMEGLLYALDEVTDKSEFAKFSLQIQDLLEDNFLVHEFTIYYWTLYGNDSTDQFAITPMCRDVWNRKKIESHSN